MHKVSAPLAIWTPQPLTQWQRFKKDPATWIAFWLYDHRPLPRSLPTDDKIKVVCISDTHTIQPDVPNGDLLLHAGDLTNAGSFVELQEQLDWLGSLPHKHKVVIAGNHDRLLDVKFLEMFPDRICETEGATRKDLNWHDIVYLEDSITTIDVAGRTLNIYGSPQTPSCGVFAFQYPPIRDAWKALPPNIDILLTHGPPRGYLDQGKGCTHLVRQLAKQKLTLVVFGHIHVGHGSQVIENTRMDRCYQKIMAEDGSVVTAFSMAFWMAVAWMSAVLRLLFSSDRSAERQTILVNAAIGADADTCREPVVVYI